MKDFELERQQFKDKIREVKEHLESEVLVRDTII
jgi:hypothetical protein